MKANKTILFLFSIVACFFLLACNNTEETLTTTPDPAIAAQAVLEAAAGTLVIPDPNNITANFYLPAVAGETSIVWESSQEAVLAILPLSSGSQLYEVAVLRPVSTDDTVTLTATLSYGIYTYEAEFMVTVKAETDLTAFTAFSVLHETAHEGDFVQATGFVYALYKHGYFLIDGSGDRLAVETTAQNVALVQIGDEVTLRGEYEAYGSLSRLTNLTKQILVSGDNAVEVPVSALDYADDLAVVDSADWGVHGQVYTVTGTIRLINRGGITRIYLFAETEEAAVVYDPSPAAYAALAEYVNQRIRIDVIYYATHETEVQVAFDEHLSGITVIPLNDEETITADYTVLSLDLGVFAGDQITLPLSGANGSSISWSSGNEAVATISGDVADILPSTTAQNVVFTATISSGSATPQTKTFTMSVTPIWTSGEIAQLPAATVVTAKGVVYCLMQRGYFLFDASGTLAVYVNAAPTVALGDMIVVTGPTSNYGTLVQINIPTATEIRSSGNEYTREGTAYNAELPLVTGEMYRITGTLRTEGTQNNLYIYEGDVKIGVIYYQSPAAALTGLTALAGTEVTIDAYFYTHRADSNAGGAMTDYFVYDGVTASLPDTWKVAQDLEDLSVPSVMYYERILYFPKQGFYGSTISWSANNSDFASVLETDEGFRLTIGTANAVISFTATVVLNDVTLTKNFTIGIEPMTLDDFADVYADPVETIVYLEGIVTGYNGTDGTFLQDAGGVGAYIRINGGSEDYPIGTRIAIRGTIAETEQITAPNFRFIDAAIVIGREYVILGVGETNYTGATLSTIPLTAEMTGKVLNLSNVTIAKYENGMIFFEISAGVYLKAPYEEEWIPIAYPAQSTISGFGLIVLRCDGADLLGTNLAAPELTDAQKLILDEALFDLEQDVTVSLTLPELVYATIQSVSISVSLENNLSYAEGIFTITRPAAGSADVLGTVTVTLDFSGTTKDVVLAITVKAESGLGATDLFISEYIEGTSYNKALEIYNGTGNTVDLSAYTLELYSNGSATVSVTLALSGMLENGKVLVISRADALPAFQNVGDIYLSNNTVNNFNGDDAIVLKHNGVIIDCIGRIGERPASGYWGDGTLFSTKDMTLVRKPSILSGRTDPSTAFDPSVEWIAYPANTATNLGTHTTE